MNSRFVALFGLAAFVASAGVPASAQTGGSGLLFRHSNGQLSVLAVKGIAPLQTDRSPEAALYPILPVGTDWTVVGGADFNADRHGDILWRRFDNLLSIWAMAGTAPKNFNQPFDFAPNFPNAPPRPFLGDFNADGIVDIIWTGKRPRRPPIGGDPNPPFPGQPNFTYLTETWTMQAGTAVPVNRQFTTSDTTFTAAVGQFNGSGGADRFLRTFDGGTAFEMAGGGRVAGPAVPHAWELKAVGDVNADGTSDLIWHHQQHGAVSVWIIANGAIASSAVIAHVSMSEWNIQAAGDMDGNNTADIVWRHSGGLMSVWLLNGLQVLNFGSPGFFIPNDWQFSGLLPTKGRLGVFQGSTFTITRSSNACAAQNFQLVGPVPETVAVDFATTLSRTSASGTEVRCTSRINAPFVNVAGMYHLNTSSLGRVTFGVMPDSVDRGDYCPSSGQCTVMPPPPPPQPVEQTFFVFINGQPAPPGGGFRPFFGRFGGTGRVTRVELPRDFSDPGFSFQILKPGRSTSECDKPDAVVRLVNGSTLSATQMQAIFGSSTPNGPLGFTGCISSNRNRDQFSLLVTQLL